MSDNTSAISVVALRLMTCTEENCRWECEV